jgi:hypothetical protein
VRDEKVSVESARADYGVVIDATKLEVDPVTTEQRRAEMRAAVDVAHPPFFTR